MYSLLCTIYYPHKCGIVHHVRLTMNVLYCFLCTSHLLHINHLLCTVYYFLSTKRKVYSTCSVYGEQVKSTIFCVQSILYSLSKVLKLFHFSYIFVDKNLSIFTKHAYFDILAYIIRCTFERIICRSYNFSPAPDPCQESGYELLLLD